MTLKAINRWGPSEMTALDDSGFEFRDFAEACETATSGPLARSAFCHAVVHLRKQLILAYGPEKGKARFEDLSRWTLTHPFDWFWDKGLRRVLLVGAGGVSTYATWQLLRRIYAHFHRHAQYYHDMFHYEEGAYDHSSDDDEELEEEAEESSD